MALAAMCGTSATAVAKVPIARMHNERTLKGVTEQVFDGPSLVCQEAFAIVLNDGEHLTSRDPGLDFMTYAVKGPAGDFVLYAGDHPMPHDDEVRTGLKVLSIIAIHDNRTAALKRTGAIRNRLIVRPRFDRYCPKSG